MIDSRKCISSLRILRIDKSASDYFSFSNTEWRIIIISESWPRISESSLEKAALLMIVCLILSSFSNTKLSLGTYLESSRRQLRLMGSFDCVFLALLNLFKYSLSVSDFFPFSIFIIILTEAQKLCLIVFLFQPQDGSTHFKE